MALPQVPRQTRKRLCTCCRINKTQGKKQICGSWISGFLTGEWRGRCWCILSGNSDRAWEEGMELCQQRARWGLGTILTQRAVGTAPVLEFKEHLDRALRSRVCAWVVLYEARNWTGWSFWVSSTLRYCMTVNLRSYDEGVHVGSEPGLHKIIFLNSSHRSWTF